MASLSIIFSAMDSPTGSFWFFNHAVKRRLCSFLIQTSERS
uniref:Uncharacterized protein n=1 Tax=Arundo donax TaxID=35708 RepID=A0A0A9BRD5_ARUDO